MAGTYNFVDHHAHSLLRNWHDLALHDFRACFTESRSATIIDEYVPEQRHYQDMLARLGKLLGAKSEAEIVVLRSRIGAAAYLDLLWKDARITTLLIDDGYLSRPMLSIEELSELSGKSIFQCRRIETVLEQCIIATDSFSSLAAEFGKQLLSEVPRRPRALKTIMSYRGGLALDAVSLSQAKSDYTAVRRQFRSGKARIFRRPLYHYFLMQAFELAACAGLPVQVHTGLGDDDQDLSAANPTYLQPLFRSSTLQHTSWQLLHCYPYVREAAMMCALYPNVFMDLSLSMTLISPLAPQLLLEASACAPWTKILASTDGHSIPETHWYAATIWTEACKQLKLPVNAESFLK